MNRLDEIEARANAATPGPWEWEGEAKGEWEIGANSLVPSRRPDDPVLYGYGHDASGIEVSNDADAEFITHARQDVPVLVAALRAVLEVHKHHAGRGGEYCGRCFPDEWDWPCATVTAITTSLEAAK